MRLLIDDALATATFARPLQDGRLELPAGGIAAIARPNLTAADLEPVDVALLPLGEVPALRDSHRIAPDAAVVFGDTGPVVMRCPVRPDEIERTPIRLWQTSSFGETLARATLRPFYGITPERWTSEDEEGATAQVVVVEGPEALRPPEAGFAEDLCRAWLILTAQPAVGHVLVVPRAAERGDLEPALAIVAALRERGTASRREIRRSLAEAHGLPLDRLNALFAPMRYRLDQSDRPAVLALLQRGQPGGAAPPIRIVEFLEPEDGSAPG